MVNHTRIINSRFFNNSAEYGGAISLTGNNFTVDNSIFENNSADHGAAIYCPDEDILRSNSKFLNNKASSYVRGEITDDSQIIITLLGGNEYINAISAASGIRFNNVIYWNGTVANTDLMPPRYNTNPGQNVTLEFYDEDGNLVENITLVTDGQSKVYYATYNLDSGKYSYKAYHMDDEYYTYSGFVNGSFEVNSSPSSVTINIYDGAEFNYLDCNISFDIVNKTVPIVVITSMDGSQVYINQTVDEDYFVVELEPNDDYYNITVYNSPTIDYSKSQDSKLFKILKLNSSIVINPIPDVAYGDEFNITFDGENLTTVNVTIFDSNNTIVWSQNTTNKSVTVPVLPEGTYQVTLINYGDNIHKESSDSTIFNIVDLYNDVLVSVDDVVFGEDVVINVFADVDGVLSVDVNGTVLSVDVSGGNGSVSLSLPVGAYYANATFDNDNYTSIITNATFKVVEAFNNVLVSVDDVVFGEDVVINVFADVDGVLSVDVNGTVLSVDVSGGNGSVSLSLPVGAYYANATFDNDDYSSVITNATFNVTPASNNVIVSVDDVVFGEDVVINVFADVDGIYSVDVNGTVLSVDVSGGKGSVSLSLPVGAYYANATFDNGNYSSAITNATFNVIKCGTVLVANNTTVGHGSGQLSAILAAGDTPLEGKTIKVNVGTIDVAPVTGADGLVLIDLSSLVVGNYTAYIVFDGDDEYDGASIEVTVSVVNNKRAAKDLQDLIDNAEVGSVIDLGNYEYENVSNVNITKSIILKGDDTIITGLGDGSPMFNIIPKSKNGPNELNITNISFKLNNGDIVFKAIADNDTNVYLIDVASINIKGNTFSAIDDDVIPESATILLLESERGILSPTGTINISANTIDAGVKPFKFHVTEIASGGDVHILPQNITPPRKATVIEYHDMNTTTVDESADGRIGEYFKVTLKDSEGNALATKDVQIGFNGVVYDVKTDEDGVAQLQINLKYKGAYTFAICFLGDGEYNASFVVAKITVKEQTPRLTVPDKSYAASDNTKTLTATFKSENGGLIANKWITFTVNGKTYKTKTDENGVASVNVSLNKKGTYSFTAKYGGDSTCVAISKTANLIIK